MIEFILSAPGGDYRAITGFDLRNCPALAADLAGLYPNCCPHPDSDFDLVAAQKPLEVSAPSN